MKTPPLKADPLKTLRIGLAALGAVALLAGCGGGTEPAKTEPATPPTSAASATSEPPAPPSSGDMDPSKGGQVTCGEWRAATREQRIEAVTVYLKAQNKPAELADATIASVDIDVYCVGTSHTNDPIEPGFTS